MRLTRNERMCVVFLDTAMVRNCGDVYDGLGDIRPLLLMHAKLSSILEVAHLTEVSNALLRVHASLLRMLTQCVNCGI